MQINEGAPAPAESALLSRRRRRRSLPGQKGKGGSKDSSDPGLPDVPHTAPCFTIPPSQQNGFGLSFGSHLEEQQPSPFLHPDDAALPPIVRMARAPPSPKAPRSPRSPKFKRFSKSADTSGRPASRDSFASVRAPEDMVFGTISAEPGPRLSTAVSTASNGSGRTKSLKGQFGQFGLLKRSSSREFSNEPDTQADRLRKSNSLNESARHNNIHKRASLRSMYSMANVTEEAGYRNSSDEPVANTHPAGDQSTYQGTSDASNNPGGIGSGRVIPTRDSSLRHRHSQSSSSRKRMSARHSRYPSTASRDSTAENGLPGSSNDAEQVTKRIQELKDQQQKIKTELEVDDSPGNSPKPVQKQTKSAHIFSQVDHGRGTPNEVQNVTRTPADRPILNESAPSPSVMTGKSRVSKSNIFGSPMSKALPETPEHERAKYRRSQEPMTPTRSHARTSSIPTIGRSSTYHERPSSADSIDLAVGEYVFSPKLTQKVIHPTSGRTIAFSEVGDPKGHVVLCCLGMGLTRYLPAFYDELARTLNLRLVTLDRPGVGESGPHQLDEPSNPLSWPDDVAIVCNHLRVTKFSILAHSAGAIYALATALRIPQHIRARIHLLAPWIPPSQLSSIGSQKEPAPSNAVPYSQRILRALPTSLLKVANTSFMSTTSASITTSLPKSPKRSKKKTAKEPPVPDVESVAPELTLNLGNDQEDPGPLGGVKASNSSRASHRRSDTTLGSRAKSPEEERERQQDYDNRLTHKIWELATTNANPAVDLLICLERRQPIGFRYVDITRSVVIHHGSKDTRVPVENVQWLGKTMRRCEVRVLEGEGHGLMASAGVMGNVLTEIAKEWEDWTTIVQGKRRATVHQPTRPGVSIPA
ncbi:hypothetical protein N7470_007403 [Penicillium chermesinum]|nr:hypothetical protein N7470_007403 [Penicillium chermesinum]